VSLQAGYLWGTVFHLQGNSGTCNFGSPAGGLFLYHNTIFATGPLVAFEAQWDGSVYMNIIISSNIFTALNVSSDNAGSLGILRTLTPGPLGPGAPYNAALLATITNGTLTFRVRPGAASLVSVSQVSVEQLAARTQSRRMPSTPHRR
jgi:hypothetical protein